MINYNVEKGELGYTDAMFLPDERETLARMVSGVSLDDPADIILPIYDLDILVPFMNVKHLHSIWFASNDL